MSGKIFVSYRRADAIATAGRLHDRLAQTFGHKRLIMDIDTIPAGVDFVEYIKGEVLACDVFLAVIGPRWLDVTDERGNPRIYQTDDFVRLEIEAALRRQIRVIPILVDGARMPEAADLPEPLKQLARRNAVKVSNEHFGRDAAVLVDKVRDALSDRGLIGLPGFRRLTRWLVSRKGRAVFSASALALGLLAGALLSYYALDVLLVDSLPFETKNSWWVRLAGVPAWPSFMLAFLFVLSVANLLIVLLRSTEPALRSDSLVGLPGFRRLTKELANPRGPSLVSSASLLALAVLAGSALVHLPVLFFPWNFEFGMRGALFFTVPPILALLMVVAVTLADRRGPSLVSSALLLGSGLAAGAVVLYAAANWLFISFPIEDTWWVHLLFVPGLILAFLFILSLLNLAIILSKRI